MTLNKENCGFFLCIFGGILLIVSSLTTYFMYSDIEPNNYIYDVHTIDTNIYKATVYSEYASAVDRDLTQNCYISVNQILFDGYPCDSNEECYEEYIVFPCNNTDYMDTLLDNTNNDYESDRTTTLIVGVLMCIIFFVVTMVGCYMSGIKCDDCDCDCDCDFD